MTSDDLAGVVLAAGAGTRLRPLTWIRPKALCPVANRPLVDLAIERARSLADDVAVNVHHGRAQMEQHLSGRVHLSVEEPEALGTAGALGNLRGWIDGRDVLVVNSDAWHSEPLPRLTDGWDHEQMRLLVVRDAARADFPGGWRYAGAALMPWAAVRSLRAVPSGLYETCWRDGDLELVESHGRFIDCGTPADYLAVNMAVSGGDSVVGERAVVLGRLVRSVVWPHGWVGAEERLVDAIRVGRHLTVRPAAAAAAGA